MKPSAEQMPAAASQKEIKVFLSLAAFSYGQQWPFTRIDNANMAIFTAVFVLPYWEFEKSSYLRIPNDGNVAAEQNLVR